MSEFKEFESKFDEWWEENYMNVSADRTEAFDIYSLGLKHQQAKVEELEQENQRLANGNTSYYNQAIKQNEIIEGLQVKLKQAYEDVDTFATAHEALEQRVDRDRSLIQFAQQANKDLIAERDELQKRVDAALTRANQACIGNEMFHKQFDDVIRILRGEQALKGGEA